MNMIILDASAMTGRSEAYDHIARRLGFSGGWGANLDALADKLWELPKGTTVTISSPELLEQNLGDYGKRMLDVFNSVSRAGAFALEFRHREDEAVRG